METLNFKVVIPVYIMAYIALKICLYRIAMFKFNVFILGQIRGELMPCVKDNKLQGNKKRGNGPKGLLPVEPVWSS